LRNSIEMNEKKINFPHNILNTHTEMNYTKKESSVFIGYYKRMINWRKKLVQQKSRKKS
jgi:hypothetical protein